MPLSAEDRFAALQAKKIDVLSRNSTWTMGRETELGLIFAAVNYYDGQGFMVRKALKINSALDLGGQVDLHQVRNDDANSISPTISATIG